MLDKGHVDRIFRITCSAAPIEPLVTTSFWVGLHDGIIYVGVVGLMVRRFPDRRGFACGIVAAGYGMGAILTTFPISGSLATVGHQSTLIIFGLIFGAIGLLVAQGMNRPPSKPHSIDPNSTGTRTGVPPLVMLRSPIFWLLFVMMSMMSSSGLMVITQMAAFAKDFGVANAMVFGTAALPLALTIDRFTRVVARNRFASDAPGLSHSCSPALQEHPTPQFLQQPMRRRKSCLPSPVQISRNSNIFLTR
jgi:MFS family permease